MCKYDFNNPTWSEKNGHFTQVVWASTQELGLGWAMGNGDSCYYVAGRYFPGGNIDNRFKENVNKGSFDTSYCGARKRGMRLRKLTDSFWLKSHLV